jgi:hypothetical protein
MEERRDARCGAAQRKFVTMHNGITEMALKGKLVCAQQLLDQLFDPGAKPSLRWLRAQTKAKAIPHIRIGHLVFFDVEMVRGALASRNLVRHRISAPRLQTAA